MKKPIVQHSVAPDPNPAKVQAALEFWRQALARRLAENAPQKSAKQAPPN